jgi:fatty-acyl-CoA synthase
LTDALSQNLIHRFNIGDVLKRTAARYPSRRVHDSGRDIAYRELDAMANRCARLLLESGIGRGDTVGILALNSVEFLAIFFACARIGAALVPVNLLFTPDEAEYVLEKTRIKALFVSRALAAKVKRQWPVQYALDGTLRERLSAFDPAPVEQFVANEDAATIIFTSGTTARPKGVVLTHLNWFANLLALSDLGFDRDLKYLLALPMFHVAGLCISMAAVFTGSDAVVLPAVRSELILDAIARHRVSLLGFPATVWVGLLQTPGIETFDFSAVRRCLNFQYLPTPAFKRWIDLIPSAEWTNVWGQTETTALGSATQPADTPQLLTAPDPIGIAESPVELRIVDELMNDVPEGQPGELVMRGPCVTPGYFEDDEANTALFYGGWHHTGDIAYLGPNGSLYFVDRKKDMIKTGGENVSSLEVEEALAAHPAVAEVAVFGMPDPYWIEKVVAAVVPLVGASLTAGELETFARARIAAFKAPKEMHIVEALPKNPTGKVLKRHLRRSFEDASGAAL